MRLGVMQPYFFPHLAYFQLVHAVERFVFLDDVTFIRGGWINRNRLLMSGKPTLVTVPLLRASRNRRIDETDIAEVTDWRRRILRTVERCYRWAPHYERGYELVRRVLHHPSRTIADLAKESVTQVSRYLGLTTELVDSSRIYENRHLRGQDRILDICRREGAMAYRNSIGGRALYSHEAFRGADVSLGFIDSRPSEYRQLKNSFVPGLSVIDVIMFNSPAQAASLVSCYEVLE